MTTLSKMLVAGLCATLAASSPAQEKKLVDFQQHVQPILVARCLDCHGPKESKGGMRVDVLDSLSSYIEAGDVDGSALWTDYLRSEDPELLMPPATSNSPGGLSIQELLVIKTWIAEGAEGSWQVTADPAATEQVAKPKQTPQSDIGKAWAFQGILHPAAVHLPIALLSVSVLFVFLSFFNARSCEPVAFHCLWIGALGAVGACLTGWSYAVHEGYGAGFSFDVSNKAIDRHRWLGIAVAVWSILMIPLARNVTKTGSIRNRVVWLFAGLILFLAVSITGFQGGELVYGEDHYAKYYSELFTTEVVVAPTEEVPQQPQTSQPQTSQSQEPRQAELQQSTEPAVNQNQPDSKTPADADVIQPAVEVREEVKTESNPADAVPPTEPNNKDSESTEDKDAKTPEAKNSDPRI